MKPISKRKLSLPSYVPQYNRLWGFNLRTVDRGIALSANPFNEYDVTTEYGLRGYTWNTKEGRGWRIKMGMLTPLPPRWWHGLKAYD